jgi:UDP-N-acetylmuramate--alanine ligase
MNDKNLITISYDDFSLVLIKNGEKFVFPVSCAKNGLGEKENSFKTPRGMHKICKKIGKNASVGEIFVSRKKTGEIWQKGVILAQNSILTRILQLDGYGKNNANTKSRYIYIHGTNREDDVGKIHFSHGCVVMKNDDIVRLFDLVRAGDYVFIY